MYVCVFLRMCQIWFVHNIDRHISKTASVWVAGLWWAKGIDNLMSPLRVNGPMNIYVSCTWPELDGWMRHLTTCKQICVCHMQIICEKILSVHFNLFWTKLDLHKLQNMFNLHQNKKKSFRLRLPYEFLIERHVNAEDVGDVSLNGYAANRYTSVCNATLSPWSQHS